MFGEYLECSMLESFCLTDTHSLYANAIAMRAAVARLLRYNLARNPEARQRSRDHRVSSISERMMDHTVMAAVEGVQVLEAVGAAIALLRHGIEIHRKGVLRFCPGRTFQRIVSTAT